MKKWLISGVTALTLVTGCANTDNNAGQATAVGAVLGAILGKATGDNDKSRYVWGAAVGAIAGNMVGRYMDQQEREFQEKLADSGVEVSREGNDIHLYLPGNITFETGSARIQPQFNAILDDVAAVLNEYPKTTLRIEGHTDDVGAAQYNQQLSESRALSVKSHLIGYQVDARRIVTVGMGEFSPFVPNDSDDNRQKNRRVELKIQPLT
ncbi:MAG: OmpA family protein [Aestuariibacter sp.]